GVSPDWLQLWRRFRAPRDGFQLRSRHFSELVESRRLLEENGINWVATVPISSEGKPIALMTLGRTAQLGYSATELRTAGIRGVQVVAAVERARLYTQLSQRVRQLTLLFELARAGTSMREVGTLVDRLLALLIDHIPCDGATMLYARGGELELGGW